MAVIEHDAGVDRAEACDLGFNRCMVGREPSVAARLDVRPLPLLVERLRKLLKGDHRLGKSNSPGPQKVLNGWSTFWGVETYDLSGFQARQDLWQGPHERGHQSAWHTIVLLQGGRRRALDAERQRR